MLKPREKLYEHQLKALDFIGGKKYWANLMEQRTGKTAVEIYDCAQRFKQEEIDAVLVMAPLGVHTNWLLRELPRHMPETIPYRAAAWYANALKVDRGRMEWMLSPSATPRSLRFLLMNWDALTTEKGFEAAREFCIRFKSKLKITGDESHRIKSPQAQRTRALMRLKRFSSCRSIMTGTPILNSPWDAFSQFNFLDENILGTTSFAAFRAEFAELLPPQHGLMRHIGMRIRPQIEYKYRHIADEVTRKNKIETELAQRLPQVVARDAVTQLPKWRNLPQLERLISPHSFRVLRKDCLDLPAQIPVTRYFRMIAAQRKIYDTLRDEFRIQLRSGETTAVTRLAAFIKLSQVTSGYILEPGTERLVQRLMPPERNPKLNVLAEEIETQRDANKPHIIWARFHVEIADIAALLKRMKVEHVEYYGLTKNDKRTVAIDRFQNGEVVFLSNQASGGVGLTLTAGQAQTYFSNTFKLEDRLQSQDRTEGIGQTVAVTVTDLLAENSIDEIIVDRLQSKVNMASIITGDARRLAELV